MSSFNWCHGPSCHTSHTQDRVRGSKGSKVLRTRRIKLHTDSQWYSPDDFMNYFCSQGCLHNFIKTHIQRVVAIAPRTEALETPINDPKKTDRAYYGQWEITEKDDLLPNGDRG
jgi:hypothetical protein